MVPSLHLNIRVLRNKRKELAPHLSHPRDSRSICIDRAKPETPANVLLTCSVPSPCCNACVSIAPVTLTRCPDWSLWKWKLRWKLRSKNWCRFNTSKTWRKGTSLGKEENGWLCICQRCSDSPSEDSETDISTHKHVFLSYLLFPLCHLHLHHLHLLLLHVFLYLSFSAGNGLL